MVNAAMARLNDHRRQRASDLSEIRQDLRRVARSGPLSALELYDLISCVQGCMPISGDLPEVRESLGEIACDLDGVVHFGSHA